MGIILCILYVLAGIMLAIPYCFLAGWNPENFMLVAIVAPAFVFIWIMLASFAGVLDVGHGERRIHFNWRAAFLKTDRHGPPWSRGVFWVWTLYSFLPVILHWSAGLLHSIGLSSVGAALDTHRYASPFYVFMATIMLLTLIGMIDSAWSAVKSGWTQLRHR